MGVRKKRVSVIGAGSCDAHVMAIAHELGQRLAKAGYAIVCGGLGGVMEGVCRGASEAGGETIGILPGLDYTDANNYVHAPVATGLGHMRNYPVILNGDVVVAVEGETGTLSELALAQKSGKKVIALGRWRSIPDVIPARDAAEAVALVQKCLA